MPALRVEAARLLEMYERLIPDIQQLISRTSTLLDKATLGRDHFLALALGQEELEANFRFAPKIFKRLEEVFDSKKVREIIAETSVRIMPQK